MVQDFVNTREFTQFLEERIAYFKEYINQDNKQVILETEMWKRSFWRFLTSPPERSDNARVVSWRLREYQEELARISYQGKTTAMIAPSDTKMLCIFYCWVRDKDEYSRQYTRIEP